MGNDDDDVIWPTPPREEMEKRWAFRQGLREQTIQHRRYHRHGGMGNTGRNILFSLRDREVHGSRYCVLQGPKRKRPNEEERIHKANCKNEVMNGLGPHDEGKQPNDARACYPTRVHHEIQVFAEYASVIRYHSAFLRHLGGEDEVDEVGARPSSSHAVSTISIAFSPDAHTMASTHGDHTVKITSCGTGILLQTLEGHPRTPWTVKYHPLKPDIVASGCLGFQVRVWDWKEGTCLNMIRLDYAIISLSFHPTGHILAIASGSRLHFWDFDNYGGRGSNGRHQTGALTEVEQRHMLRCVHFPPGGNSIIVGGMNPQDDSRRPPRSRGGMSGGGISFYLRLWDFDLDPALNPTTVESEQPNSRGAVRLHKRPLANVRTLVCFTHGRPPLTFVLPKPRLVVPRALLYNDGGFDISPDGKVLCACAEYWLPEGVNNAMDLLRKEQIEYEEKIEVEMVSPRNGDSESKPVDPTNSFRKHDITQLKDRALVSPTSRRNNGAIVTPYLSPPRRQQPGLALSVMPPPPRPQSADSMPLTPPNPTRGHLPLSPPSPPGRRWIGGLGQRPVEITPTVSQPPRPNTRIGSGSSIPPPPPPPPAPSHSVAMRRIHPLSMVTEGADVTRKPGRYVPHVVTVSLETAPLAQHQRSDMTSVARGHQPRLGQLLEACPLDGAKASAVTCVKFSPSANFCLLGYGVREPIASDTGDETPYHPVTALYRVRGGMTHVSTMLSSDDDVNIARFHPDSGYGFVYGTKQGRVRVLSPRPWNFYNC